MEPRPADGGSVARLGALLGWRRRPAHPPTLTMVVEALQARNEKRGTSVVAIKRYILAKYPAVDAVRLKYLLKQALTKGLSRGFLVRPHNSSALGATGRFKLAPEKLRQGKAPGQADPASGKAPKPARKRTTKALQGPMAGDAGKEGTAAGPPGAARPKPRAKTAEPRPPAPAKPRSDGAKPPGAGRGRRAPRAAGEGAAAPGSSAGAGPGAKAAARRGPAGAAGEGRAPGGGRGAAPKKGAKAKAKKPASAVRAEKGLGEAAAPKAGKKAA